MARTTYEAVSGTGRAGRGLGLAHYREKGVVGDVLFIARLDEYGWEPQTPFSATVEPLILLEDACHSLTVEEDCDVPVMFDEVNRMVTFDRGFDEHSAFTTS